MSRQGHRVAWALVILTLIAGTAWLLVRNPAHIRRDIAQERLTYSLRLASDSTIGQSFTARHNGLEAIEVLIVRFDPDEPLHSDARIILRLERLDRPESEPVTASLSASHLEHNQPLRFWFEPFEDSANGSYRFTIHTSLGDGLGVWASNYEALDQGTLWIDNVQTEGDLRFSTYHAYHFGDLWRDLLNIVIPWLGGLVASLLLLAMPGVAVGAVILPRRTVDPMIFAAVSLAGGMSFWPILLLWTTTLDLPMSAPAAWGILALFALGIAIMFYRQRDQAHRLRLAPVGWPEIALITLLALTVLVRLIQVRDLIVPAWVDSVHHTMITQLIAKQGVIPRTGEPYISILAFHYHFGFHANAALLSWLSGLPPYRSVLFMGQWLNGLAGLPLYALTSMAISAGRLRPSLKARWAGVVAAAVPSFLTYMPAYYVSWGRYTQLAGLLILPVLLVLTFHVVENSRRRAGPWLGAILLIGGLALTHYRVLTFYIVFWIVYVTARLALGILKKGDLRIGGSPILMSAGLAIGSLILIAPWVLRILEGALLPFDSVYVSWTAPEGSNIAMPMNLLRIGRTEYVLGLTGFGMAWSVVRRRWKLTLLGAWVGGCLILTNLGWLGLPQTWFIHATSAAISYWVPAGLFIGWLVADLLFAAIRLMRSFKNKRYLAQGISAALLILSVGSALGTIWPQIDPVNENTILVHPEDLPAIEWVRQNLPEDSLILVNTRPWMADIRMGSDAGWWLPYLTGYRVTYPSVLYTHGIPAYRDPIKDLASTVDQAESLDDPAVVQALTQAGVTHVFVGKRGGPLEPQTLTSPHYHEIYRHGPTRVYRFEPITP